MLDRVPPLNQNIVTLINNSHQGGFSTITTATTTGKADEQEEGFSVFLTVYCKRKSSVKVFNTVMKLLENDCCVFSYLPAPTLSNRNSSSFLPL